MRNIFPFRNTHTQFFYNIHDEIHRSYETFHGQTEKIISNLTKNAHQCCEKNDWCDVEVPRNVE